MQGESAITPPQNSYCHIALWDGRLVMALYKRLTLEIKGEDSSINDVENTNGGSINLLQNLTAVGMGCFHT